MRELYMKNGEGFVLVYSITSLRSFEDLDVIRQGIIRHKNKSNVSSAYFFDFKFCFCVFFAVSF